MRMKNNEHYTDPTPYYAIHGTDEPKVGEVYEYRKRTGGYSPVLIVATQGRVCTILTLGEKTEYSQTQIRGNYHTNVYQMGYAFNNKLGDFMFCLTDDELNAVQRTIKIAFGLIEPVGVVEPESIHTASHDVVNHPDHYCPTDGGRECIDEMRLMFGDDAVMDFCRLNVWKYRFRAGKKNGQEDLNKAEWYVNKIEELGGIR